MVIPLAIGLVGPDGQDMAALRADGTPFDGLMLLTQESENLTLSGLAARPCLSLNRSFAAPIQVVADLSDADLAFLAGHDSDPFNRWQAAQTLVTGHLRGLIAGQAREEDAVLAVYAQALAAADGDQALAAQILSVPGVEDMAREIGVDIDHGRIHTVITAFRQRLADHLRPALSALWPRLEASGPFSPDAQDAGRRALRAVVLSLLCQGGDEAGLALADALYRSADNMTDRMAALSALAHHGPQRREVALSDFYARYAQDPLIIDKWMSLQASVAEEATFDRVKALMSHPAFSLTNPNRLRALIGAFALSNPTQFNRADGAGYELLADVVLAVDPKNGQVAARLLTAFRSWAKLEPARRAKAEAALKRVQAAALTPDSRDIVERTLAG